MRTLRFAYRALYAITVFSLVASAALTAAGPAAAGDAASNDAAKPTWHKISGDLKECDEKKADEQPDGYESGPCPDKVKYTYTEGDICYEESFYGDPGAPWAVGECAGGEGACFASGVPDEQKSDSDGNPSDTVWGPAEAGSVVSAVCIKAGTYKVSTGSDGTLLGEGGTACYEVSGIGTDTVTVTKIGEGSGCKDISHFEVKLEEETGETCEDQNAINFGEEEECLYYTCTDDSALNYHENTSTNPNAPSDCVYETCEDENAINFGEEEECLYYTCTDENAINFQENTSTNPQAPSDCLYYTCDDRTALNYHEDTSSNPEAEDNCIYPDLNIIDPGDSLCGFFSFKIKNTTEGGLSIPKVTWLIKPGGSAGSIEPLDVAQLLNFGPADNGDYTLYAWIGDQGELGDADTSATSHVTKCPSEEPTEEPEVETESTPEPEQAAAPVAAIPVTGVFIPVTGLGDNSLYLSAQLANLGFTTLALGMLVHGFVLGKREDED